jgi:Ca2+-binding EF-hand superfamily protein
LAANSLPYSATFNDVDSNGDGYLNKAEAIERGDLARQWSKIDKDQDGKIDLSEFTAYESTGRFSPPEESQIEIGAAPTE